MPYVPNPVDGAAPLDAEIASTAAAEFRALKTYIQATIVASIAAKLPLAGGTLTGNLLISKDAPVFRLSTPSGFLASIEFETNLNNRWIIAKTSTAETGSDVGSNLTINRYDDAGALIDTVLSFARNTGTATFGGNVLGTLFSGRIQHTESYLNILPFSGIYDDGSNARVYWDGILGRLVFTRNGGSGDAGIRLVANGFIGAFTGNLTGDVVGNADTADLAATATLATDVVAGGSVGTFEIGFRDIPRITGAIERGKMRSAATGFTLNDSDVTAGYAYSGYNSGGAAITITQGAGVTLKLENSASTGNRTVAPNSFWFIWCDTGTVAIVSGTGVT